MRAGRDGADDRAGSELIHGRVGRRVSSRAWPAWACGSGGLIHRLGFDIEHVCGIRKKHKIEIKGCSSGGETELACKEQTGGRGCRVH